MAKDRAYQALKTILSYRRPADTRMVRRFANRFLRPLGAEPDTRGNWWLQIGKDPIVLWSAHIDTVHSSAGRQQVKQLGPILYTPDGDCLGADDGAGTWMLREMAKASVPGLYIWHTAEERGCQGSSWIASYRAEELKNIKFALAFDRRGTKDIINTQMGGRCCSSEFVAALSEQLGMGHSASPGSYTDTAEYAEIIPECSNISVGFQNEHQSIETLDTNYLFRLRDRVISRIDPTKWPVARTPAPLLRYSGSYSHMGYNYGAGWTDDGFEEPHWWTCPDNSCTSRDGKTCDVYKLESETVAEWYRSGDWGGVKILESGSHDDMDRERGRYIQEVQTPDGVVSVLTNREHALSYEEKWVELERNYHRRVKEEPTSEDCLAGCDRFDEEAFLQGELAEDELEYREWLRQEAKSAGFEFENANWGYTLDEEEVSTNG